MVIEQRKRFGPLDPRRYLGRRSDNSPMAQLARLQEELNRTVPGSLAAFREEATIATTRQLVKSIYEASATQSGEGSTQFSNYESWGPRTLLPLSDYPSLSQALVEQLQIPISHDSDNRVEQILITKALVSSDDPIAHKGLVDYIAHPAAKVVQDSEALRGIDLEFTRKEELLEQMAEAVVYLGKVNSSLAMQSLTQAYESILPGGTLYQAVEETGEPERLTSLQNMGEQFSGWLAGHGHEGIKSLAQRYRETHEGHEPHYRRPGMSYMTGSTLGLW